MEENEKPKKPKKDEKQISHVIPSDIIVYDILTRIPTVSLIRFRCVCKNWSNLFFHNPLFINSYSRLQRYSESSSALVYIRHPNPGKETGLFLGFLDHNPRKERVVPLSPEIKSLYNLRIQHSLNGFLVLSSNSSDSSSYGYYVYNPITRHSIRFPIPIEDVKRGEECACHFCLCYDPIVDKHKVVFCGPYKRYDQGIRKIKILTLGDNGSGSGGGGDYCWRDIVVPKDFVLDFDSLMGEVERRSICCRCLCVRESLYWIIESKTGSVKSYILGLDTSRELFYRIKLPKKDSLLKHHAGLNEMGGLLFLSYHTIGTNMIEIWTLKRKDYGKYCDEQEDEWVESYKVDMNGCQYPFSLGEKSRLWPLALLTNPRLKFIFAVREKQYWYTYFSYDVELKQFQYIYFSVERVLHWHVNSIAYC